MCIHEAGFWLLSPSAKYSGVDWVKRKELAVGVEVCSQWTRGKPASIATQGMLGVHQIYSWDGLTL